VPGVCLEGGEASRAAQSGATYPRVSTRARTAVWWAVALASVCLLALPIHEVGHWIAFTACRIPAAISLDHTYYTRFWAPSFAGAFGGPLMSVAAAWVGVVLVRRVPPARPLGVALALFMPSTRLVAYAVFATHPHFPLIYNDEGVMGLDTGIWPWAWVLILLPFLIGPLVMLWRDLPWTAWQKAALFAGGTAIWYAVGIRLEAGVLDPRFFPQAESRELVMPYAPRTRQ
jgi:hypothetical protein